MTHLRNIYIKKMKNSATSVASCNDFFAKQLDDIVDD